MELFPYEPREGQEEVYEKIRNSVRNRRNFILHAPTGFGKTITVLSSILAEKKRIIWVSRTGNAINRVIEELNIINKVFAEDFKGISFRGKKDMCLRKEAKEADRDALKMLCKNCEYRSKIRLFKLATFNDIYNKCINLGCCPYFSQINSAISADVVAMNYNYLFNEHSIILDAISSKEDVLVIDEAHNIVDAFNNNNSDILTSISISRASREAILTGVNYSTIISKRLMKIFNILESKELEGEIKKEDFLEVFSIDEPFLEKIGLLAQYIYELQIKHGKAPRSYLARFYRFMNKILSLQDGQFIIIKDSSIKIIDMRAGDSLRQIWDKFSSVIAISGTIKPVEQFKKISGLTDAEVYEIKANYKNVKIIAIRGLTTKGKELDPKMVAKYLQVLNTLFNKNENFAIFTASYRIMKVFKKDLEKLADYYNKRIYFETENISMDSAYNIISKFKESKNNVLVAVFGGRFSEGVDFPGDSLKSIFLLGIPFERLELEVKLRIKYYEKLFKENARYYAYIIPALRKASQAIGRLIRSPEDSGTIYLGDERYLYRRYFDLLPDFVKTNLEIKMWRELSNKI